jgi:hypothetical protein
MSETIVVKIQKTHGPAGLERGIEVPDDFRTLGTVVFQDETSPDQVKGPHAFKRMAEVMEPKAYAGFVPIVLLRILDAFFRVVDTQDPPAGLNHLTEDRGDLAGSASRIKDVHSGLHPAPYRLTPYCLGIGLEFKAEGFF